MIEYMYDFDFANIWMLEFAHVIHALLGSFLCPHLNVKSKILYTFFAFFLPK